MVVAAGRRVDQAQSNTNATDIPPGYELSFLLALQPALEDLAKHRIKLAVNAGNTDTQGLYDAVTQMIRAKGLDLKVGQSSFYLVTWGSLAHAVVLRWPGCLVMRFYLL